MCSSPLYALIILLSGQSTPEGRAHEISSKVRRDITGIVLDERGCPIPGALVERNNQTAYSDEKGRFILPDASEKIHVLFVSAEGYAGAALEKITPGSEITVRLIRAVTVSIRIINWSLSVGNGVQTNLKMTHAWGDKDLSPGCGNYGISNDGMVEVRPGSYTVSVSVGGIRVVCREGVSFAPRAHPCLVVDFKGIDGDLLKEAVEVERQGMDFATKSIREMASMRNQEREGAWKKFLLENEVYKQKIRRLQDKFDQTKPARLEVREDF